MNNFVDYGNICEATGVRVQDGDHLVEKAVLEYAGCKTLKGALAVAIKLRRAAARDEKYLVALIHDTIADEITNEIENE